MYHYRAIIYCIKLDILRRFTPTCISACWHFHWVTTDLSSYHLSRLLSLLFVNTWSLFFSKLQWYSSWYFSSSWYRAGISSSWYSSWYLSWFILSLADITNGVTLPRSVSIILFLYNLFFLLLSILHVAWLKYLPVLH